MRFGCSFGRTEAVASPGSFMDRPSSWSEAVFIRQHFTRVVRVDLGEARRPSSHQKCRWKAQKSKAVDFLLNFLVVPTRSSFGKVGLVRITGKASDPWHPEETGGWDEKKSESYA